MHSSLSFTSKTPGLMLRRIALLVAAGLPSLVQAHFPDRENQPVHPRIDVIGPLGTRLPPSYRRAYNRPSYLSGKIAYYIAPSSQEAMAWHRAVHRGLYDGDHRRVEDHYLFPKPWEALRTGQRRSVLPDDRNPAPRAQRGLFNGDEGMISEETPVTAAAESPDAMATGINDAPVVVKPVPVPTQAFLPTRPLDVEPNAGP